MCARHVCVCVCVCICDMCGSVQAISVAPPWDVGDMLAGMKKDMGSSLHSNGDLARSHARLQGAWKGRHRPLTLPALADLAAHLNSMLLMLPLPAKTDQGRPHRFQRSLDVLLLLRVV